MPRHQFRNRNLATSFQKYSSNPLHGKVTVLLTVSSVLRTPQLLGEAEAPLAVLQTQSIHITVLNFRLSFYLFYPFIWIAMLVVRVFQEMQNIHKHSFLQSVLQELGIRDTNTTFTNKTENLQNLCEYVWNCPRVVWVLLPLETPFFLKTPSTSLSAYKHWGLCQMHTGLLELPFPLFLCD